MKKIKTILPKIVLAISILFFCPACEDFLEEDTSSLLSVENLNDEGSINAAITGIYAKFSRTIFAPQRHMPMHLGADDVTTWWAGNKAPLRVFDRLAYGDGQNSDIVWLPDGWDNYWQLIYYCNEAIAGLKESTVSEDVVNQAMGEARFFRGLAYFNLVRMFGNVPIVLDETNPTGEEQRATVIENYGHIEEDLLFAESNLPAPGNASNVGKLTSAAAKTVLADFYMTWAGWPVNDASKYADAAENAKEVIDMNYFRLLPIDELWLQENQNSRESIFSAQFSESEELVNAYGNAFSFHEARGWSDMYPELQFFYDFPEGPRKEWTFYTDIPQLKYQGGEIVPKDPPTVPWEESGRHHPMYKKFVISGILDMGGRVNRARAVEIYRYAEVLLQYAEASARANGGTATGQAVEAYNKVKRRAAGLPYDQPSDSVDVSSVTAEEVLQERAWELAGEVGKRWFDLVRTETLTQAMERRTMADEDVKLAIAPSEITWKQYIAPIPFNAITNSDLTQNPEGFQVE